jgi:predicted ABC-type ATPase
VTTLTEAVDQILEARNASGRPLAIIVAGHNGSGKSTMWYDHLAPYIQMPLVNADRMMMSILPEPRSGRLPPWAQTLRNENTSWMRVAQRGVEAFVLQAMAHEVPFAMETVFSDWRPQPDGTIASKIDRIVELQAAGYFVLLLFVGLSDAQLSIGRVMTRVSEGGHAVDQTRLLDRFPRTQRAIAAALPIANAAILADNSREPTQAFTVCRVQMQAEEVYDLRADGGGVPAEIAAWLNVVAPRQPRVEPV